VTVTPTFGVRPVAALSLQFWSEGHSFVFVVQGRFTSASKDKRPELRHLPSWQWGPHVKKSRVVRIRQTILKLLVLFHVNLQLHGYGYGYHLHCS